MSTVGLCRIGGLTLALLALLSASCAGGAPKAKTYAAPPPMKIDPNKQCTATIQTEKGDMVKYTPGSASVYPGAARRGLR